MSLTRNRFGLDVDGILYDWDRTARYMLRTEFGYPRHLEHDNESVDLICPGCAPLGRPSAAWNGIQDHVSKAHWQWLWGRGVKNGLFRYGHLYVGSIEAVRALAALGDVVIITHRPRSAVQDTLDWLSFLKLPFTEIHLLTDGSPKSGVPHCSLYVDDKPENIIDYAQNTAGMPLLWRRPWNAGFAENAEDESVRCAVVQRWGDVLTWAKSLS